MSLRKKVTLIDRSSKRMMDALDMPHSTTWWNFMRRESWLHLRRSIELWWLTVRKKD